MSGVAVFSVGCAVVGAYNAKRVSPLGQCLKKGGKLTVHVPERRRMGLFVVVRFVFDIKAVGLVNRRDVDKQKQRAAGPVLILPSNDVQGNADLVLG